MAPSASKLTVYREEADGAMTDLKGTYNSRTRLITFETDHFSHYILTASYPCEETGAHSYEPAETKPATCTENGYAVSVCSVCGSSKTEDLPATGHTDANGDGVCDVCRTSLSDGSDSGAKVCKYCGKVHTGFFGWLVSFFHSIAYFFKTLFKK